MFGLAFAHRPKSDGFYDSICAVCFMTAASDMPEEELKIVEDKHTCDKDVLRRRAEDMAA